MIKHAFVLLALVGGCARYGYNYDDSTDAGILESDDLTIRASPDVNEPSPDVSVEQDIPSVAAPQLHCGSPSVVGTNTPPGIYESSLRADGFQLIVQAGSKRYASRRSDHYEAYGAWKAIGLLPGVAVFDLNFFTHNKIERAMGTQPGSHEDMRQLLLCELTKSQCDPLPILNASGTNVTHDADGPSVVLTSMGYLMAHNIARPPDRADIYIAKPSVPHDPTSTWITTRVSAVSSPEKDDDPTLSPDGKVLVFDRGAPGNGDLWASTRASLSAPFSPPRPLAEINTPARDLSASLARPVDGEPLELYFFSDRDGTPKIYLSRCEVTAGQP